MKLAINPVMSRGGYRQLLNVQISCVLKLATAYTMKERDDWVKYLKQAGPKRYSTFHNMAFSDDTGKIVAYVSWTVDGKSDTASIECLYTLPRFRRQGLAATLLRHAEDAIGKKQIHIRSTLSARSFYDEHGYRYVGSAVSRAGFEVALMVKNVSSQAV